MALVNVAKHHYASPHYTLRAAYIYNQKRYWSITRTATGEYLARRITWRNALDYIAYLEEQHALRSGNGLRYTGPLATGEDLRAFRDTLFPGLRAEDARQRMAAALCLDRQHLRHLECDNRVITPRTANQLHWYGIRETHAAWERVRRQEKSMAPALLFYEALTENNC